MMRVLSTELDCKNRYRTKEKAIGTCKTEQLMIYKYVVDASLLTDVVLVYKTVCVPLRQPVVSQWSVCGQWSASRQLVVSHWLGSGRSVSIFLTASTSVTSLMSRSICYRSVSRYMS